MADEDKNWHVKREISVGHMVTTIALCAALITGWDALSDRVDRLEITGEQSQKINQAQDRRMEQLQQSIDDTLDKLDGKLDRLIGRILDLNGNNR